MLSNLKHSILLKWGLLSIYTLMFLASVVRAGGDVKELTPSNFDSVVGGDTGVLVEFYAPWCGHCKNLMPIYEQLGASFAHARDRVTIAKIDANEYQTIGQRYEVQGYPTIKWFPKGSKVGETYSGGRDLDSLSEFVAEKVGTKTFKPKASVVVLSDKDFDSIVGNGSHHVLVEFYAPWCGHCKNLAPIYERLAKTFITEKEVIIANLDATVNKEIAQRYKIESYPQIKFFAKGGDINSPLDYSGEREEDDFVDFLNLHTGTLRQAGGGLLPRAGRLLSLDYLAVKAGESKTKEALEAIIVEAKEKVKSFVGNKYAQYYVRVMERYTKNKEYVGTELLRLDNMIEENGKKMSAEKLDDFYIRINILRGFLPGEELPPLPESASPESKHDEL